MSCESYVAKREDLSTGWLGPDRQGLGRGLAGECRSLVMPLAPHLHQYLGQKSPVGIGLTGPSPARNPKNPARAHRHLGRYNDARDRTSQLNGRRRHELAIHTHDPEYRRLGPRDQL
jgi:hypothetical protein